MLTSETLQRWVVLGWLLVAPAAAWAHVVDQYVEATQLQLAPDGVGVTLRLTPGTAVFPQVLGLIDRDEDGQISATEQASYAERVRQELTLSVEGLPAPLTLERSTFPPTIDLRDGSGAIELVFRARAQLSRGGRHLLRFENQHAPAVGAYLVNVLLPLPPGTELRAQRRDVTQHRIDLELWVAPDGVQRAFAWLLVGLAGLALMTAPLWFSRLRNKRTSSSFSGRA